MNPQTETIVGKCPHCGHVETFHGIDTRPQFFSECRPFCGRCAEFYSLEANTHQPEPIRLTFRCPKCGHRWESATDGDCPKCEPVEVPTTHTPGPWIARFPRRAAAQVFGPRGECVSSAIFADSRSPETMHANARLVAAAPELLAGLQGALEVIEARVRNCEINDWQAKLRLARAAIAKATE